MPPPSTIRQPGLAGPNTASGTSRASRAFKARWALAALLLCAPGVLVVSALAGLRSAGGADVSRVLPMALGAGLAIGLLLLAAAIGAHGDARESGE